MKHPLPLVTIIVVTLNNLNLLRKCLNSLYAQDYGAIEIVVIDNGSDKDVKSMFAQEFPDVRMVRLNKNYGFAGGNNRGIEGVQSKYIALINNDAVASPQWISSLVATAESDKRIGAVASIIIDGNRPEVLDSCGVGIGLDGMSRQAMRGKAPPELSGPKEVLLVSGCACLFRMAALRDTGLFDEAYFAYCEDTDLGLRLRWAGWKAVIAPGAKVKHNYSMTVGKASLNKVFWVERNHFWVVVKNFPTVMLPLVPLVTVWRYILQAYAIITGSGDIRDFTDQAGTLKIITTILLAQIQAMIGTPSMLRKRFTFSPMRRISDTQMCKIILSFRLSVREIIIGSNDARN
ncbi:MAG: glycosyltransferase family 2 protein [Candidatus Scalinduaceae bacterium]